MCKDRRIEGSSYKVRVMQLDFLALITFFLFVDGLLCTDPRHAWDIRTLQQGLNEITAFYAMLSPSDQLRTAMQQDIGSASYYSSPSGVRDPPVAFSCRPEVGMYDSIVLHALLVC